jgi:hypothetical protein
MISPVVISQLAVLGESNRLDIANVPVGRNGVLLGSTTLSAWTTLQNFGSTNLTQSILIPAADPPQFYRLTFPFTWSWP